MEQASDLHRGTDRLERRFHVLRIGFLALMVTVSWLAFFAVVAYNLPEALILVAGFLLGAAAGVIWVGMEEEKEQLKLALSTMPSLI